MRNLFVVMMIALSFSSLGFAHSTDTEEQVLNNFAGSVSSKAKLGTLLNKTPNLVVGKYSYAKQGGNSTTDINLRRVLSDPKSTVVIPNNAIIQKVWYEVLTQPTGGTGATIALKAASTGDLLAAKAVTILTTGFHDGAVSGASTGWIKLSADKTIKVEVDTNTLTAGVFNVYIEYVLGD